MATKSTRHKIRVHGNNAVKAMDDCLFHLQSLQAIANDRSTIITEQVPVLANMVLQCQKILDEFCKRL